MNCPNYRGQFTKKTGFLFYIINDHHTNQNEFALSSEQLLVFAKLHYFSCGELVP